MESKKIIESNNNELKSKLIPEANEPIYTKFVTDPNEAIFDKSFEQIRKIVEYQIFDTELEQIKHNLNN